MGADVVLDLGWGRLVFGQTFRRPARHRRRAAGGGGRRARHLHLPARPARAGRPGARRAVHRPVLHLPARPAPLPAAGRADPRRLRAHGHLRRPRWSAINEIYARNGMVLGDAGDHVAQPPHADLHLPGRRGPPHRRRSSARSPASTTGWPSATRRRGTSLWCLAVHAQDAPPGTGEALVRVLAERYVGRGRAYLDLSVMHDNEARDHALPQARLHPGRGGLRQAQEPDQHPAVRRPAAGSGGAQPLRADHRRGGAAARASGWRSPTPSAARCGCRSAAGRVLTRESLSEFTTAVAMSRCDDKRVTRRIMERAGVRVRPGRAGRARASSTAAPRAAARGRRGRGQARPRRAGAGHHRRRPRRRGRSSGRWRSRLQFCPDVLVEELVDGDDLRVVVIDRAGRGGRRPPPGRDRRRRPAHRRRS